MNHTKYLNPIKDDDEEAIKEEIKRLGWRTIFLRYNPTIQSNVGKKDVELIWRIYQTIYLQMKARGEI